MLNQWKGFVAGIVAAAGMVGCTACANNPLTPKTVAAAQETCPDRAFDAQVYCYAGLFDGAVFALALERDAGTLSPEVESAADASIKFIGPRLITVKEGFSKVSKWQTEVEVIRPLADKCFELPNNLDNDTLSKCLTQVGWFAVSGKLSQVTADAKADWLELRPKLAEFVGN